MKTVFSLCLLIVALTTHATIRTVCNDPTRPANFTGVQAAINAALVGDTIYVFGSPNNYGSFTINKKVILVGAGYASSNQFGFNTIVNTIDIFDDDLLKDPTGSVITGFNLDMIIIQQDSKLVSNITVFRNYIREGIFLSDNDRYSSTGADYYPEGYRKDGRWADGWRIYNNVGAGNSKGYVIGSADYDYNSNTGPTNILIQNNILDGVFCMEQSSVNISNNIFLQAGALYQLRFAIVSNNVFIRSGGNAFYKDANWDEPQFNTFSNNLSNLNTIGTVAPTNDFGQNNNTASGNFILNTTAGTILTTITNADAWISTDNYRLISPGTYQGTDGTQIGIYGGNYPFPSGGAAGSGFDTAANPPIPQVVEMIIQNGSLLPSSQLKVSIKAKINN